MREPPSCTVIRVPRCDTLQVRAHVPHIQATVTLSMVLVGVRPEPTALRHIIDWVELHADCDQLRLLTADWARDSYGRLLADLADPKSGETLTDYLREQKCVEEWPSHWMDTLVEILTAECPNESDGYDQDEQPAD